MPVFGVLAIASCNTDDSPVTGTFEFRTSNPLAGSGKTEWILQNPSLEGDTTITENTSLKVAIGDIWVSQGEVKEGQADNLEWIRLTSVTNTELKLVEDYVFTPVDLPAGTYKSIKMTLRNIFYRHVRSVANPDVVYELLETMGSTFAPCDENDTTWAKTNYFSTDGNHVLNNGVFQLVSAGERIGGFEIEADRKAIVTWRFGAGATEPCMNKLIDLNGNLQWDCGTDDLMIICPPGMDQMADFVITYE